MTKKIMAVYAVTINIEVPDNFFHLVRLEQLAMGEMHLPTDPTDEDIAARISFIRGLKGFNHDESMTPELNDLIDVRPMEVDDYNEVRIFSNYHRNEDE